MLGKDYVEIILLRIIYFTGVLRRQMRAAIKIWKQQKEKKYKMAFVQQFIYGLKLIAFVLMCNDATTVLLLIMHTSTSV